LFEKAVEVFLLQCRQRRVVASRCTQARGSARSALELVRRQQKLSLLVMDQASAQFDLSARLLRLCQPLGRFK